MKIGKKLTLAIALTLGSVIIGTNVNAVEINKRILSENNLLLGASVDSSYSNETITTNTKEFKQSSWWDTWANNGSVEITWDELKNNPELLCIESEAGLPSGTKIKYSKKEGPIKFGGGESEYAEKYGAKEDHTIAYILSEEINEDQNGTELYEQDIQGALWRTKFNMDRDQLSEDNLAGEELYNIATTYGEYRAGYSDPQSIDAGELKTVNSSDSKIVGPLKIKYKMTYLNTADNTVLFGNITEAILKDSNGTQYTHKTDWWFVDKDKKEISNSLGNNYTYNYPLSEQVFYIKIRAGLNITKANLSFKFNNIIAQAEAMTLKGSYEYPGREGESLHLCSNCRNKLNEAMETVKCGTNFNGTFREGYRYYHSGSKTVKCGNTYEKYKLPAEWTDGRYATAKNTNVYVLIVKVYGGGVIRQQEYEYVNCGQTYTYAELNGPDGNITETRTGYCGGSSCAGKEDNYPVYTYVKCAHDGSDDSCSACKKAYKEFIEKVKNKEIEGCLGKTGSYTKIGKDGQITIGNTSCGVSSGYGPGTAYTQTLTIAKGERGTTRGEFTLTFDVASVDIALRKYITAINDVAVTPSREPKVDTTPIKNGQATTAYYNHPKTDVGVKVGDIVTYTIRVYNEGTVDGYAKEIIDALPSNLEFYSSEVDGKNYGWTKQTGNVYKTSYLANEKLDKFSDGENYNTELDYAEVKMKCKVKETARVNERMVNIAAVSSYAYYDEYAKKDVLITSDIDSTQGRATWPDKWQTDYAGNGSIGNYVKGEEDDDDFDVVKILYTNIGGTVWLDGVEGKQEERDGKLTSKDKRMSGITVRLYTSTDKYKTAIAETTTDKDGNYTFTKAKINGVEQNIPVNGTYLISFEYGGQQYIPVVATRLNSGKYTADKSAGEEDQEERTALNDKFYEIVRGTAKNSKGTSTVALKYTKDTNEHTSTIIRDTAFNNASKIVARTEGGFSGTASYVKNINLGLLERAQVNLGLMTDVAKVELDINGNTATYDYNGRDEGTAINLEAKAADLNRVYNQAIYESDYNYRIDDYNQEGETVKPDKSNELQVYITYKVKVKNYSSKAAKASQLVAYFAPEYNVVDSWYTKEDNKVKWETAGEINKYKKFTTTSIKDVTIGANEDIYVYVKVEVAKNAQGGGVALGEKYIVAELGGYTTEEGLIDTNSEPGNIDVSNWDNYVKTYEDDTDRAPGLNLTLTEAKREMTGFVWEDSPSGTDADNVKIGDGIKNGNEQNKNGITVQLIELVTIGDKTYEYIWQEVQTGSNKVSYMDRNGKLHENSKEVAVGIGEYKFTDFVPGKYIVRFKYGDTEASISTNGQDYKSTTYKGFGANTSSAKDNKDRRLAVMNYSIKQTNEIAEVLAGKNKTELIKNTWMYADTVDEIKVDINTENLGYNVNFGLLKRPTSKLLAIKEVNGIKISNKGIVYVDTANGINTGLREAYGSYFIELDDELINGAQLEVSYKVRIENRGENDTLYNYFEGETKYGNNQHEIITTRAELVYDYPEKIGYDEDNTINPSWTKNGVDINILKGEVQEKLNNGALVIKATEKLNKALKPGESTDTIYMTLSKIMAAGGDDDLNYSNKVEIVSRINEVGRRDEKSIPGNYNPNSEKPEIEPDTGLADVTITDPTGQDRIYYGLGIGIGILLIVGIVLIKKFALGKKK